MNLGDSGAKDYEYTPRQGAGTAWTAPAMVKARLDAVICTINAQMGSLFAFKERILG